MLSKSNRSIVELRKKTVTQNNTDDLLHVTRVTNTKPGPDWLGINENIYFTSGINVRQLASKATITANYFARQASQTTNTNFVRHRFLNGTHFLVDLNITFFNYSTDFTTWVNRPAVAFSLTDIAWGANIYVASKRTAGTSGQIYTSTSIGGTWTARTLASSSFTINAVCFGNGIFVAGGTQTNAMYTSTNGTTWTLRTTGIFNQVSNIVFANGIFIMSTTSGINYRSTDGITWTQVTVTSGGGLIRYLNGKWYMLGNTSGYRLQVSTDNAISFTRVLSSRFNTNGAGVSSPNDINYFNGLFYISGGGILETDLVEDILHNPDTSVGTINNSVIIGSNLNFITTTSRVLRYDLAIGTYYDRVAKYYPPGFDQTSNIYYKYK